MTWGPAKPWHFTSSRVLSLQPVKWEQRHLEGCGEDQITLGKWQPGVWPAPGPAHAALRPPSAWWPWECGLKNFKLEGVEAGVQTSGTFYKTQVHRGVRVWDPALPPRILEGPGSGQATGGQGLKGRLHVACQSVDPDESRHLWGLLRPGGRRGILLCDRDMLPGCPTLGTTMEAGPKGQEGRWEEPLQVPGSLGSTPWLRAPHSPPPRLES